MEDLQSKINYKKLIFVSIAILTLLTILPYIIPLKEISTTKTKEELISEEGRFLKVDEKQIYIEDFGDENSEKVIVLIHGFGSNNY